MRSRARFGSTMLSLSAVLKMYGRELTDEFSEIYWNALADLTDDEFERAAAVLIRRETEFPPPAMFLAVARPPAMDPGAAAHAVMLQAWNAGKQTIPGEGCWWSAEAIRAEVGEAAYEAFHACGGSSAFRDIDNEFHGPRIRREFAECYQRVVLAEPAKALPAGPQRPALTTGEILETARELHFAQREREAPKLLPLHRPERLPCTPEEQAVLDRIGEKLAAKRAALNLVPEGSTA